MPRSWLKPTGNILVLFEELGGNPIGISLAKRSMKSVCADMFEYRPNSSYWHTETNGETEAIRRPKIHLQCSPGLLISSIKFASFGTPLGSCGNFQQGACHAPTSYDVLRKVYSICFCSTACIDRCTYVYRDQLNLCFLQRCIGKEKCAVTISNSNFGQDPCPNAPNSRD